MSLNIPSFIDIHVHAREPGEPHKETIETAMLSALQGGCTMIGLMPNTKPPVTDIATYNLTNKIADKASKKTGCKYIVYQAAVHPPKPPLPNVPIKLYLNCTTGDLKIDNPETIEYYFKQNLPLVLCHAELDVLPNILALSEKYKKRHISVMKPEKPNLNS